MYFFQWGATPLIDNKEDFEKTYIIVYFFQWGATPLIDNKDDFEKTYLISVYTGVRQNGGTKSMVRFILSGEYSDTGIRRLEDATGKRVNIPHL